MPTDQLPGDLLAGPYGFLVAIAFFLWLAAREWRRGREIDVSTYRADVAQLQDDLADVKADLAALRDDNAVQSRRAALREEALIRENASLRALLAEHQITTDHVERT